jgi:hypothetical protein
MPEIISQPAVSHFRIGDRARWGWYKGSMHFGRVLKLNRTTVDLSDEKYGTARVFRVQYEHVFELVRFSDQDVSR